MAEQDEQGKTTRRGAKADAATEQDATATETSATSFQDAADAATPAEQGYIGTSPEAERTGRADKGLSQQNPAILTGGPVPDPRPGVDDRDALDKLAKD